ncbi:hypothetical protein MMC10_008773 [Thelotrema lepadinum]|nr:hypothetical protein [Thelotrema lepadinum]
MYRRQITILAFLSYIGFTNTTLSPNSWAEFHNSAIRDSGEYSNISSRDKPAPTSLLYTRDATYSGLNDNLRERHAALAKFFPRNIADQVLLKRVLAAIEVAERIEAFKRETRAITAKYSDEKKTLNRLLHPETGATDARLEALAKHIVSKKSQDIPLAGVLKEDAAKYAKELSLDGRSKEAKALIRAQKEYTQAWGRHSRVSNVIVKQYEEYKRTGRWPRRGDGGSEAAGEQSFGGGNIG